MKITFLGTGGSLGIPVIGCDCAICNSSDSRDKRLRPSVFIEHQGKKILIDIGPDFRQQMLNQKFVDLDFVLLTHEHNDHVSGIDDIRPINFIHNKDVPFYANEQTTKSLETRYSYVFRTNPYPGVPKILLNTIDKDKFEVEGIEITSVKLLHASLEILGFRIGDFAYITDASFISEEELAKIMDCEYLIINALRKTSHRSHYSLSEAIEIAKKVKAKNCFITHIGHQMGFHEDVEKELPSNIRLGYDGLAFEIK